MTPERRRRKHLSMATKLAAALLTLNPEDREAAKQMTAAQYVSLFQFDHAVLHTHEGSDHFTNLTPMLIKPHRAKSAIDQGKIAKVNRIEDKWNDFMRFVATGQKMALTVQEDEKLYRRKYKWPKRKIPSRPFSNKKRRPPRGSRQLPNSENRG